MTAHLVDTTLTDRQRLVLDAIRTSIADRGYPPTMAEIGEVAGLATRPGVLHVLRRLEAMGWIQRDPHTVRGIRVLNPGADS